MAIVILHGDNQVESRKRLSFLVSAAKKKGFDVRRLEGKGLTSNDLLLAGRSQSLLGDNVLVVVEDFLTANKKASDFFAGTQGNSGATFVFWEGKPLSLPMLKKLSSGTKVEEFKIPRVIFKFLESLIPGNTKASLELFHAALKEGQEEFIFTMLSRQVRLLIWAKEDPEGLNLPSWQKTRLLKQAEKISKVQLRLLHGKLLEIDRENKKSQLPEGLSSSLELLLLSL